MSIEGVASSYADIYSENLTYEDIKNFDDLGVEWRGRNILDIRDDVCIKAIVVFARVYEQTALTNPAELPQLKAEIIQIFEDLFETESEDEDETSSLLYRFDPISGTYRELIGAEGHFFRSVGKGCKKVAKKVEKGVKKAEKAVTKAVRETGRWVKEHPVETVVIVAAAVTLGVTAAAIAGAGSAAADAGSDDDHKKDQNKDNKPSSPSPPTPPTSVSTPIPISSILIPSQPINPTSPYTTSYPNSSAPTQPFVPPNPYIPYSQSPSIPHQYDISKPPIFIPSASGTTSQTIIHPTPDNYSFPLLSSPETIVTAPPEIRPARVEPATLSEHKALEEQSISGNPTTWIDRAANKAQELGAMAQSGLAHAFWEVVSFPGKVVAAVGDAALNITKPLISDPDLQNMTSLAESAQKSAAAGHEKIDEFFGTDLASQYDPVKQSQRAQFVQAEAPGGSLAGKVALLEKIEQAAKTQNIAKTAGVFAREAAVAEEVTLANKQLSTLEKVGTLESRMGNVIQNTLAPEKTAFNPIRVQSNGIWEVEGNNIRKFNPNILSNENKLNHIFEDPRHQLNQLASTPQAAFEKVTKAIIEVDQTGGIPANQPFVTRVVIDGLVVEVRGIVSDGELKIGTFFVPEG